MKKLFLMVLSNMALCSAAVSLSQCSQVGGHQPELPATLKSQILKEKGKIHEDI